MKIRCLIALSCLILLTIYTYDAVASYDDVIVAEKRGDYKTVEKLYLPLAKRGDVIAQLNLGSLYAFGHGEVKRDYVKAKYWWEKAYAQGNPAAAFNLGKLYYNGFNVLSDHEKSYKLTLEAANGGNPDAQLVLAVLYIKPTTLQYNEISSSNYPEAYKWLSLSASQNNVWAMKAFKEIKQRMTLEQIKQGNVLLKNYKGKHKEDIPTTWVGFDIN